MAVFKLVEKANGKQRITRQKHLLVWPTQGVTVLCYRLKELAYEPPTDLPWVYGFG